jgi:GGDEF domain-containing protein
VLPETGLAGARTFFTALRESLIDLAAQNYWPVGFSIGVAVFHSPKANPDDAIRHADGLMYRVKHSGKNNVPIEECASDSVGDRDFFASDRADSAVPGST